MTLRMPVDVDLVAFWIVDIEDGRAIENRVFSHNPEPSCRLCGSCKAVRVKGALYACSRVTPDDGCPSVLPFCRRA
jgi:hypothetical protein